MKTGTLKTFHISLALVFILILSRNGIAQKYGLPSLRYSKNQLIYSPDSLGNKIPDYSFCGYHLSNIPIPDVKPVVMVSPVKGDATSTIQGAIDYVSKLPLQTDGSRGTVLLNEGVYNLNGRLKINASGIVLRGYGQKTIIRASGTDRETLLKISGNQNIQYSGKSKVSTPYITAGSSFLETENPSLFKKGETVFVHQTISSKSIKKLGMDEFGGQTDWLGWKPGERIIKWEREITEIKGNTLFFDIPFTSPVDSTFGQVYVESFSWSGRISEIGVENLTLESETEPGKPKDENHCWYAITFENVRNAWIRQVNFRYFAGSAVAVFETGSKITVKDCISKNPVSEIAGARRNIFFTMGQQTLFLRCLSENGNHDFSTGFCAAGPNAFVQCESRNSTNFSGCIDSWSTGTLFDIVNIDGHALSFKNRGQDGQGAGWTAVGSMFWQCSAARIECFSPTGFQNFAYGTWGQFAGNGLWYESNSQINPRSLFFAQLAQRRGENPEKYEMEILPFSGESTTSPTLLQAEEFTKQARKKLFTLEEYIGLASFQSTNTSIISGLKIFKATTNSIEVKPRKAKIKISNGYITGDSGIITGTRTEQPWWRGVARPYATSAAAPAITRFVPGRSGLGYTDLIEEVISQMKSKKQAVFEHNYGLWYDRRRDDHERIKRFDSESWPPFYEQPFSRSGEGEAWDRLSKYDLTKYNSWYWQRLGEFARKSSSEEIILFHQHYFQHNILEAGAHYADFPWRSANNINNTGFFEPPNYSGDKRIYMAEHFYNISDPVRKNLHRQYIRKCLDNFSGLSNVFHSISAEFTGPFHFVAFWLDIIKEWSSDRKVKPVVVLSVTKDIQDSVLSIPEYRNLIDIIDIRYWAYKDDGSLYAPPGGKNLAPRQFARIINPGSRSFQSVYQSVIQYSQKYPEKAVIYSESDYTRYAWAVLMAGGSLPGFSIDLPVEFLVSAAKMKPNSNYSKNNVYLLENKGHEIIGYTTNTSEIELNLSEYQGDYKLRYINSDTGRIINIEIKVKAGKHALIPLQKTGINIFWLTK